MSDITTNYVLTRGVEEILPGKDKLASQMESGSITLYQGFDPTGPSLHIGHFIGIRKLAQFQKLGHKVIFLIGDFTAMIGDPTDKAAARTVLTKEHVLENLKDYKKQVSKVIDFEGENKAEVKFNSEWLSKLSLKEIIELSANFTVQQMIERDMFDVRMKDGKPIYLHEFLYPLMVGYDSKVMQVDLEIGGSDQLFNMLAGRTLQKLDGKDKCVLTMKLLTDKDGKKMGKTEGNAIFLSDSANEIYAKIMSWPDDFIKSGVDLLTDIDASDLHGKSEMDAKKMLALDVVSQICGEEAGKEANEHFEKTFQDKKPDFSSHFIQRENLAALVAEAKGVSVSEAKRLILQGAVEINGKSNTDPTSSTTEGDEIRIGSHTFGTVVKEE